VGADRKDDVDMILASANADSKVRAIAVKDLVALLAKDPLPPSELVFSFYIFFLVSYLMSLIV
jgi:hypothetical protein